MRRSRGRGLLRGARSVLLLLLVFGFAQSGSVAHARLAAPTLTIDTDELASGAPFLGLGVELDPYDSFQPTAAQWNLIFQRLDFMRPGFIRVVEPASDYFGGYDAAGNPVYRWTAPHVVQLLTILGYAQSRGIAVVLGDWANPLIAGDARIPAEFLAQLRDMYGFTDIEYYNVINEPNDLGPTCEFGCWTNIVRSLASELAALGLTRWVQIVGPDNANSWDDTATAQALDRTSGLDTDNPIGGDSWVTATLRSIPGLIGAYDSHRYATIWGVENGVYADQVRARREQISNLDSPAKPYFAGEAGMTARQVSPFPAVFDPNLAHSLAPLLDPSARASAAGAFVDSQPYIQDFDYGVWMGDMMIQAIGAGLSGASAWDLDDAMHLGGGYGAENLKQWGFWNSLGGQDGYPAGDLQLRPWYYSWSILARNFPEGSQTLLTPSSGVPGLRVAAAKIAAAAGYYVSFAIVNDSDTPRSITLSVPSALAPLTLARYDYFAGDSPVDADGFPIPAQTLQDIQLSAGLSVELPSRGLVVLSSLQSGTPVKLSDGRRTLLDNLDDWSEVYARSKGLKLDRSDPPRFNYDPSRATTDKAKKVQYLIYRAGQISSFELKAYYNKALAPSVYRSQDGEIWTPVALASTNPAPTVGGHSYLAEILPGEPIPAGTNQLKIELRGKDTELGQVTIEAARAGPACLAQNVHAEADSLGGIPLGASQRRVRTLFGTPSVSSARTWHYCVIGGGEIVVVFAERRVSLIASSAAAYRPGGIGPGSSVTDLRRRLSRDRLRSVGGRIFVATIKQTEVVFATRASQVRAVAIATPSVLASARALSLAIKRAHLQPTRTIPRT